LEDCTDGVLRIKSLLFGFRTALLWIRQKIKLPSFFPSPVKMLLAKDNILIFIADVRRGFAAGL